MINISFKFEKFFIVIESRNGFGVDVESTSGRPIALYTGDEITWALFDGLIFLVPFFNISIGNCFVLAPEVPDD